MNDSQSFRGGLALPDDILAQLNLVVAGLQSQVAARFVLVVDQTGDLLTAVGQISSADTQALSSLLASDTSLGLALVEQCGLSAPPLTSVRQTDTGYLVTAVVMPHHIALCACLTDDIPLTWGLHYCHQRATELGTLLGSYQSPTAVAVLTNENLSVRISHELDDIWLE